MGSIQSRNETVNVGPTMSTTASIAKHLGCLPRLRLPNMLHKLRGSLMRHLRRRRLQTNTAAARARRLTRKASCAALLRPMPRCSSFGSCGTLLTLSKRAPAAQQVDCKYAEWKCMFEHAAASSHSMPRAHDITEALAGQTTPRGFPSHTDARHFQIMQAKPIYDVKVRRRLSFRLPKLNSEAAGVRRPTSRERRAQAQLDAQLQRDLRDLEDYYGGFYYARPLAERLVGI